MARIIDRTIHVPPPAAPRPAPDPPPASMDANRLASCAEAATRYRDERDAARADAKALAEALDAISDQYHDT